MKYFRAIDVWSRVSESRIVRYRCFQILPDNLFCVQSADSFNDPVSSKHITSLETQFYELLLGEDPDVRSEAAPTIEEAIARFREDFRDFEVEKAPG